jgi:hypothetical protein
MRDLQSIHLSNALAVLDSYKRALLEHHYNDAVRIREANPDLASRFSEVFDEVFPFEY